MSIQRMDEISIRPNVGQRPKKGERYLFAPWVVPVLGGPGAVGLPSGALPHGLRPVSAPARLSQDTWFDTWLDFITVNLRE